MSSRRRSRAISEQKGYDKTESFCHVFAEMASKGHQSPIFHAMGRTCKLAEGSRQNGGDLSCLRYSRAGNVGGSARERASPRRSGHA